MPYWHISSISELVSRRTREMLVCRRFDIQVAALLIQPIYPQRSFCRVVRRDKPPVESRSLRKFIAAHRRYWGNGGASWRPANEEKTHYVAIDYSPLHWPSFSAACLSACVIVSYRSTLLRERTETKRNVSRKCIQANATPNRVTLNKK